MSSNEQSKGWKEKLDTYELEVVEQLQTNSRWTLLEKNNAGKTHDYHNGDEHDWNAKVTGEEKHFIKTKKYKYGDCVWYSSSGGKDNKERTKWRANSDQLEFQALVDPPQDKDNWSPVKLTTQMLEKKKATSEFFTDINNHLKQRRVDKKYEESSVIKEYRGIVELLIKDALLKTKILAEIFDEAVLFALLMIIIDDACNLQKGTASKEKQAYRNLERYLVFLNAREELIEQNLDNTESVEFSLWSMSGIEFSEIRQSLDEKRFASLPVFVKHAVLNHIEEEKPKTEKSETGKPKTGNSKDIENDLYWSPLAHATKYGNLKCIKLLLDARFRSDASHQIKFYDAVNQISRVSAFTQAADNPTPYDLALIGKHSDLYPGDIGFDADSAWDPILEELKNEPRNDIVSCRIKIFKSISDMSNNLCRQ